MCGFAENGIIPESLLTDPQQYPVVERVGSKPVATAPPHLNPSPSFVVQEAGFFIGETGLYRLMLSHVVDCNPSQRRGTKRGTKRADGVIFQFVHRLHWGNRRSKRGKPSSVPRRQTGKKP